MAKQAKPFSVIFRVDKETKESLDGFCGDSLSQQHVLESLLKWFNEQSPNEKRAMIEGRNVGQSFGDIIERLQWANHAFSVKRWDWATEEYLRLLEESQHMPGIARFAQYRIGYCTIELAIGSRRDALRSTQADDWARHWGKCIDMTRSSVLFDRIAHKEIEKRFGFAHPVVTYNEACSLSFLAQVLVEQALGLNHEWITELGKDNCHTAEIWQKEIGPKWKGALPNISRRVDRLADSAMSCLKSMGTTLDHPLISNPGWLGRLATEDDPDLIYLWCDPDLKDGFQEWVREFVARTTTDGILNQIKDALPNDLSLDSVTALV